jgi:hypothetical protein
MSLYLGCKVFLVLGFGKVKLVIMLVLLLVGCAVKKEFVCNESFRVASLDKCSENCMSLGAESWCFQECEVEAAKRHCTEI